MTSPGYLPELAALDAAAALLLALVGVNNRRLAEGRPMLDEGMALAELEDRTRRLRQARATFSGPPSVTF